MARRISTRKTRRRDKIATHHDLAKIKFDRWKRLPGMRPGELAPSAEVMHKLGVSARTAYGIMLRSKDELIEMHQAIGHDIVAKMMADLADTSESLKALAQMIDAAEVRVLAAVSARLVGEEKTASRCA